MEGVQTKEARVAAARQAAVQQLRSDVNSALDRFAAASDQIDMIAQPVRRGPHKKAVENGEPQAG